jgi:hypothetical protein
VGDDSHEALKWRSDAMDFDATTPYRSSGGRLCSAGVDTASKA